ncbi:hypothetical protein GCM10027280_38010 [Micromonospora polyrhachis]
MGGGVGPGDSRKVPGQLSGEPVTGQEFAGQVGRVAAVTDPPLQPVTFPEGTGTQRWYDCRGCQCSHDEWTYLPHPLGGFSRVAVGYCSM